MHRPLREQPLVMLKPRVLLAMVCAFASFAGLADDYTGGDVLDAATMERARVDYLLHCGGCHLADGKGNPPNVPTLDDLEEIISTPIGRDYVARVPGASQVPISDQALADVFNWILVTTTDAEFEPLTAEEVGSSRRRVLADPVGYRQQFWPEATD